MSTPLRILILEDRPADAELMVHELRRAGFEFDWQRVDTEADYVSALREELDLILADYTLPQFEALRALRLLQERDLDIPLIVVTGSVSEEAAVACMKQGAADYLIKDRMARLGEAARHALRERKLRREKRQAEKDLQRYVERLRTLHAVDGAILAAWSPEDTAQAILRHVRKLIPCQWASVTAFDLEADEATVLALHADVETATKAGMRIPLDAIGVVGDLQHGKVHVVEDIAALPQPSAMEQGLQAAGVRSYINAPLIARGKLIGSLSLGAAEPGAYTPEHVEITHELAGQLAIAIQQARLHEQIERHAEELEEQVAARTADLERRTVQLQVAAEVARDATTAHSLDDLLNRAVALIQDRFRFYYAGIFLVDERREYAVLRAATGEAGRQMLEQGHRLRVGQVGIVGYVTGSGKPRIAQDVKADAVHFKNPLLPETRSEVALPLRAGGRIIGALDVQSVEEASFSEEDMATLQILADQLAVAIERTRLFEQTQAALEERLRTVVSNTPVILFALDREGVFTLLEGKGLDVIGLKPGELVGRSAFDVYHDVPQILEGIRRALAGETNASAIEEQGLAFDAWYSPLHDESGEITGIIGVATDVTKRKHLEEQIQRQERLAAVGQLAGGIAHDFNNFLTTIILYARMLQRMEGIPSGAVPLAETVASESRRASQLVRQILDFSRRSAMETEPVDLVSFVEETVGILRQTLPENIRLLTETERGEYVVNADPTRIQQVVMNLALNARDAMPEGGELRIGLSGVTVLPGEEMPVAEMSPGEWVCLGVTDTGAGMTEEVQSHLFEPFFTTKGAKGTGLGLAQVYGIIQQHGGGIQVESELGQGTRFHVYLPLHNVDVEQGEVSETTAASPTGRGETILLVEDEERVQQAGQAVLESLGYRVLTAANGRQALEVYRSAEGKIALVLTDAVMPEMGCREMIQELRKTDPGLKVLVVTGYAMAEEIQALKQEGIFDIIHKPFEADALAQAVRGVLDRDS